jgi:hypothetical protein
LLFDTWHISRLNPSGLNAYLAYIPKQQENDFMTQFSDITQLLDPIKQLHTHIRAAVVAACEAASLEAMSAIAQEEAGDTIYAIDRISEELLVDYFQREVAVHTPIVLIGEGLAGGQHVLPDGSRPVAPASSAACATTAWRMSSHAVTRSPQAISSRVVFWPTL